jgi:hypothetical protein
MKKILPAFLIFVVAFAVLFISIFESSVITYPSVTGSPSPSAGTNNPGIEYPLPKEGNILPDSPFWKLKALRDRVWFEMTLSHLRKAQLALLFADKRIVMSQTLFERGESEIAFQTFTKAEKYLPIAVEQEKIARTQGTDTNEFLMQLTLASLKHREITEHLIQLAPESMRPLIVQTEMYANNTYETTKKLLESKGLAYPKNPFIGE